MTGLTEEDRRFMVGRAWTQTEFDEWDKARSGLTFAAWLRKKDRDNQNKDNQLGARSG